MTLTATEHKYGSCQLLVMMGVAGSGISGGAVPIAGAGWVVGRHVFNGAWGIARRKERL